jgi:pyruvate kinase
MKKTKIICTIGPVSENVETLRQLMKAGMNAARLNFSHGDYEEHGRRIENIKKLRKELDLPVAIILDTKGPEIRTGLFKNKMVDLVEGQKFVFTSRDITGDENICSVSYKGLPEDVKSGDTILVNDGLVAFNVDRVEGTEICCTVLNSGQIGDQKGMNVPGVPIRLPALTQKDIDDILFGIKNGVDIIAASFIRKAEDVVAIRRVLEENGGGNILIISKIENREGVENIDEIIRFSNGIMVARGDLGVEIPVEDVPMAQKWIIEKCNKAGKPVITATQLLDSMIRNPRPTRAEVTDVANAIFDGTDCTMLSGETASGKYPVESVKMMAKIAERTEMSLNYEEMMEKRKLISAQSVPDAISYSVCTTAAELGVRAIITATMTGHTARRVAKFRPKQPIIAVTPYDYVARKLSVVWGVCPIITKVMESADDIINLSVEQSLGSGYVRKGDMVVIAAGVPVGFTGTTNMIKVHVVGDVLVNGKGAGNSSVYGNARILTDDVNVDEKVNEGDIIVVKKLIRSYLSVLDMSVGVIVEERGLSSDMVVECIRKGIPIITGAGGATEIIKDGALITLDVNRGIVFSGKANVL